MSYIISGLDPTCFRPLFDLDEAHLHERGVVAMMADAKPGYPCRVTLTDAAPGTRMLLINHVSHDVANPYRASHAIFIADGAHEAARFVGEPAPVMRDRALSLRGFDASGMMVDAALTVPGEAHAGIVRLLAQAHVAYLHVHNAVRGCYSARVDRI